MATNTARVRVFLNEPMPDMQGYQLHLGVSGGQSGQLDLVAVSIEPRGDFVFNGVADRDDAFNVATGQMLSLLELGGVATRANAYLATFTYRVSAEALGDFVIDVLHDASLEHQTFLVASDAGRIEVNPVTPGVVQTGRGTK